MLEVAEQLRVAGGLAEPELEQLGMAGRPGGARRRLTVRADRAAPRSVAVPVYLQAMFMLAVMALTLKAVPIMDSITHLTGTGPLPQTFGHFTFWGIYLRGAAAILAFLSSVAALAAMSRTPQEVRPVHDQIAAGAAPAPARSQIP